MMIATCVHGDPNYRIGIFFANWSLVACSDNSAKKDVMPYDYSCGDGDTEGTVNVLLLHYDWFCAYIDARY